MRDFLLLFFPLTLVGCAATDDGAPPAGADSSGTPDDSHGPDDSGEPAATPALSVNELMADNETAWAADDGSFPDWIELYNDGGEDVDLLGWSISDDVTVPSTHVFAASLIVPANGFLVLAADGLPALGPTHLAFALSSDGEELALFTPEGRRADWIDYHDMLPDVSAARVADGSEEDGWHYVSMGTPGASNEAGE